MGNQQPTNKNNMAYLCDLSIHQMIPHRPNSFPANFEFIISKTHKIYLSIPKHPLQEVIINTINSRFQHQFQQIIESSTLVLTKYQLQQLLTQSMTQNKWTNSKQTWVQLQLQTSFLQLLKKIQFQHNVEIELLAIMNHKQSQKQLYSMLKLNSIRKHQNPIFTSLINKKLYLKLYLYYYTSVLRKCLSSKNNQIRNLTAQFDRTTGDSILQFIKYDKLQETQLLTLAYTAIYIDRHMQQEKIYNKLKQIRNKFQQKLLQKEHSLKISQTQHQKIKKITRCYLDELYFCCIKEAQDPQVGTNQSNLPPLKGFPINRVKQKNRSN